MQARTQDAQNASTSYVVRKVHGRRNSIGKFMRKRFVLTILCDKGMPAAIMTTPLRDFMDWMRIRSVTPFARCRENMDAVIAMPDVTAHAEKD